jgi:NADPH:quinone reductase-like Zn-dependent oxidoreductase
MKKLGVLFNGEKAFVPGADYAGVIHAAGKNSKWTVGQEVHGMSLSLEGESPVDQR